MKELFEARDVSPRLLEHKAVAEYLPEHVPGWNDVHPERVLRARMATRLETAGSNDSSPRKSSVHQQKQIGRMAPAEDQLRGLLVLLEERKGSVLSATIAQRLKIPEFRVNSIVAAVQRVLNVEGYAVVAADHAAKTITLNVELLRAQFALDKQCYGTRA